MRLVVTNAHKNPIVFDAPWMHVEQDEEAHLSISPHEAIDIAIPRLERNAHIINTDPTAVVRVGIEWLGPDSGFLFYIDVSSDASESTERIFEQKIEPEEW